MILSPFDLKKETKKIRANTIYAIVAIYRGTTNDLFFEIYDEIPNNRSY